MSVLVGLISKFGVFCVFVSFILLAFLILSRHFGVAEKAGNYVLLLTLCVVFLKQFKKKGWATLKNREIIGSRFLTLGWVGLVVLTFLVFRAIFSPGPAVWGDAPYFYPGVFKDFFTQPLAWESRGKLGVAIDLYWIYPLMLVYNGLGVLGLSNDLIIRLVFYFPAILFAFWSPLQFSRYLGFSPIVGLFSAVVYL